MAISYVIILDIDYKDNSEKLWVYEIKDSLSDAQAVSQLNPGYLRELNRSDFTEVKKLTSRDYEFKNDPGKKYPGAIYKLTSR